MALKKNILITGGTGLVGSRLTKLLVERGDQVSHLSRSGKGAIPTFLWDVESQKIDPNALQGVDTIVHLAGANVADDRWTPHQKQKILNSRVRSTELLHKTLKASPHHVKSFVSASAIGYYGFEDNMIYTEEAPPGDGFLATVTHQWENKVKELGHVVPREVRIRIGIVLSSKAGALKEMANPIKYFVGAPLGSGNQVISWIHIDDLCRAFIKAIDDPSMKGPYNAVAQNPATNRELTKAIAKKLNRPILIPSVPGFVLKLMLGEMAGMILKGSRVSSSKLIAAGFDFQFPQLEMAVENLLGDQ